MGWTFYALAIAFSAALLCLARMDRVRRAMTLERDAAEAAQRASSRALQVAVNEVAFVALALRGQAAAPATDAVALVVLSARLLALSDVLKDQTATGTPPVLHPEPLEFGSLLEAAVAQVAAAVAPGRRMWRIEPALQHLRLNADRRAMQAILLRVAANAAFASRDGDWIELRAVDAAGGPELVIEDEGTGSPEGFGIAGQRDSRGVGLGLTLARTLIEAQGGSLLVEGSPGVGTRVTLRLPAGAVLSQPIIAARSMLARAQAAAASSSNSSASFFMTVPPSSSASTIVTARR